MREDEAVTGKTAKESRRRSWPAVVFWTLMAGAVAQELRKPQAQREWHGRVAGAVPYDLRPPSVDRIRSRVWDPDNPKIVMPQVFGVGWTLNLGRLKRLAQERFNG